MKYSVLFLFMISSFLSYGQRLDEFEYLGETYGANETYVGLNPTYTFVRNKVAPFPGRHKLNAFSGDFSFRKVNFEQGKASWNWQHKMVVDVFLIIGKALTEDISAIDRKENTALTCGIIGWLDMTWALNKPDKRYQISLGINHHDYFYGSTYSVDTIPGQNWASFDPQGYYFAAGPVLKLNYMVNNWLMLEMSNAYSFSYWRAINLTYATNPSDDYPLPGFGQVDLELQSKWGFFTGFNYNWINNRGDIPNKGRRLDLLLGFRFMI